MKTTTSAAPAAILDIALAISKITDITELDRINEQVRLRKSALQSVKAIGLRPGQRVAFNHTIRPAYLKGLVAEVVRINGKSVTVKTPSDPAYGRFSGCGALRVPLTLIQL